MIRRRPLGARAALTLALATLLAGSFIPALGEPHGARRAQQPEQQAVDERYTALIHDNTTDPKFLTPIVDSLPASESVPSPLDFNGYIAGQEGHLTYAADVHAYMRAVADNSPRVAVVPMGMTEEGRERILVITGSKESIANLERYKQISARLADPRHITDAQAEALIGEGKAIYWATGGLHSGETGPPEMLMELVYRMAVDERPIFNEIRDNVIFIITPVVEVDGRERIVDVTRYRAANPGKGAPNLIYWGKYIAHDNNRDGIGLALTLSTQAIETSMQWHPQVFHDLHESVPFLYIMSGHGPFNAWLDPITTEEWVEMAWREVRQMNEWNVPGVWTFNFFDGWAANYLMYAVLGRNGVGRFYETFGNSVPDTMMREIGGQSERAWYRMNPPTPKVLWSLRNNTNLMQSALVVGLHNVATNKERFLRTFYDKGKRALDKPNREGPGAWVIPANGPRPRLALRLLQLLRKQTIEVHRAAESFEVEAERRPGESDTLAVGEGDWIVRMDQPYSRLADMLLDYQYYNPDDPRPYDDTGWTLGASFNVDTWRVETPAILEREMVLVDHDRVMFREPIEGSGDILLLPATGEPEIAGFRFALADVPMRSVEESFSVGDVEYPAGTLVIEASGEARDRVAQAAERRAMRLHAVAEAPAAPMHDLPVPRTAIVHTWINTQSEGWWRVAFDGAGVPYDYVSTDVIAETDDLSSRWDVLILAPGWGNVTRIVQGARARHPIPWQNTELTPNLGHIDSTADMGAGIGFDGVAKIQRFVEGGGVIIAATNSVNFMTDTGIAPYVSVDTTPGDLQAQGALFNATVTDFGSPIAYGYSEDTEVYFSRAPLLRVNAAPGRRFGGFGGGTGRGSGRRGETLIPGHPPYEDPDGEQAEPEQQRYFNDGSTANARTRLLSGHLIPEADRVPRIVMRFADRASELLVSGMLGNGRALTDRPAIIDVPAGDGHVVLFAINPMWRNQTHGQYGFVFNTLLHHRALSVGRDAGDQDE